MARLLEADYRGALRFLYEAGEVEGPEPFPESVRYSLGSLLRADSIWHWTIRDAQQKHRWGWGAAAVADRLPPDVAKEFDGHHRHEDPMSPASAFLNRPLRRSDLIPRRAWQRTGIWAHIDRPLGAKDWVRIWVGSHGAPVARLEFDNCRTEWEERVVSLLEVLTPHLRQLLQRANLRAATNGDATGLTPREREVLSLVADGRTNEELARILWISPNTVRKHLENAFDKLDVHTRAAAVSRAFGRQPASDQ